MHFLINVPKDLSKGDLHTERTFIAIKTLFIQNHRATFDEHRQKTSMGNRNSSLKK